MGQVDGADRLQRGYADPDGQRPGKQVGPCGGPIGQPPRYEQPGCRDDDCHHRRTHDPAEKVNARREGRTEERDQEHHEEQRPVDDAAPLGLTRDRHLPHVRMHHRERASERPAGPQQQDETHQHRDPPALVPVLQPFCHLLAGDAGDPGGVHRLADVPVGRVAHQADQPHDEKRERQHPHEEPEGDAAGEQGKVEPLVGGQERERQPQHRPPLGQVSQARLTGIHPCLHGRPPPADKAAAVAVGPGLGSSRDRRRLLLRLGCRRGPRLVHLSRKPRRRAASAPVEVRRCGRRSRTAPTAPTDARDLHAWTSPSAARPARNC